MCNRVSSFLITAVSMLVLLAGCRNDDPEPLPAPERPPIIEEETMTLDRPERPSLQDAVSLARRDLAERLDISPEDIRVDQSRQVTWPNGALGCPEEGMMYTQALVEGFYIVLEAGNATHAYHAGRDGVPFPCPAERSKPPARDQLQDR